MKTKLTIKTFVAAAVVTAGMAFAGTSEAAACDHCVWQTVTVYAPVTKPYTYFVTRRDHCGKTFRVARTGYRTVKVPVQKRVRVCY